MKETGIHNRRWKGVQRADRESFRQIYYPVYLSELILNRKERYVWVDGRTGKEIEFQETFTFPSSQRTNLAEFRMKTSSDTTCIPAAKSGFKKPRNARVTPIPSTVIVP